MKTIAYTLQKELPLLHEAEIIVVGGGPGGLGAAVMAARAGADTLLIERYGFLGGMASAGEVHPFMGNHVEGRPLDGPVYTDWIEKMRAYWPREGKALHISRDAAMLGAEDLCREAGVRLLYHHALQDVLADGGPIDALVLFSKSGLTGAKAKLYVDCTGDADLAALAGCACEQGDAADDCQPMTTCFKLGHVDRACVPHWDEINRLFLEAKARGEIECPRDYVLFFDWLEEDVLHFNTTRIQGMSGTRGEDLSKAEIEGRRQVRQFLQFFRTHVPGYEKAVVYSLAPQVGVRETRRVKGLAVLNRDAFEQRAKFPDAIARVRYPIDIHSARGDTTELVRLPEGEWYEIPYGCIVARDRNNLLIGGRPISVDRAIHSSMRVMGPACSVGQAAGMAAAMAVKRGCRPGDLDGRDVRKALVERGARL